MTRPAERTCQDLGRIAAYTVYNAGGSVLVGLVRTVVAVAYMAKHWFYKNQYQLAANAQRESSAEEYVDGHVRREGQNREARWKTRNATGLKKFTAKAKEWKTRAGNAVAGLRDEVVYEVRDTLQGLRDAAVNNLEQAQFDSWKAEAVRGLTELFWIGAPYQTYQDNFAGRKVSIFGLSELRKKIEAENAFDEVVHNLISEYNPWF